MIAEEIGLRGAFILKPQIFRDERGYFFESFKQEKISSLGIDFHPVQDNESYSVFGTVRGLHFQKGSSAQAKLVRVVQGEIKEVIVDLRLNSETFRQKFEIIINSETKEQLYIPKGFAHGFSVLSETATVLYKCDNYYDSKMEAGIYVLDEELNIDWRISTEKMIISSKDKSLPQLKNFNDFFNE